MLESMASVAVARVHDLDCFVGISQGERPSVRREGQGEVGSTVTQENISLTIAQVPHADGPVFAGGGKDFAVPREGQASDQAGVSLEQPRVSTRLKRP